MSEIEQLKCRLDAEITARLKAEKDLATQVDVNQILQNKIKTLIRVQEKSSSPESIFFYSHIFHIYSDAIFIIDREKNCLISCNSPALEMFGLRSEEQMYHDFERFFSWFPGSCNQKNILSEAYRININFEGEAEFENSSNHKFIAHVRMKPFQVLDKGYCMLQLNDITDIKTTEKNLLRSQKKYQNLINYSQALICTHDLFGDILHLNYSSLEVIGKSVEQATGMNIEELIPQEYAEEFHQYLKRIDQNGADSGIMMINDREGKKRYFIYNNYKVENDAEVPYIVGFAQDISERILIERNLKRAISNAEASSNVRKIFLANMSHEMRTPLNGILGMSGLMAKTSLDQKQMGFLNIIKSSADNLLLIINDILDITKIESGKLQLENITFSISDTIRNCVKSLIYKAEEKGLIMLSTDIVEGNAAIVQGDPFRLNQILLNLLNNSVKFTQRGQVEISNKILSESNNEVVYEFKVRDTGVGIPPDKLNNIFEGFTQADTHITRQYGGTGLGLNICKSLLHMLNGTIHVDSTLHLGSTFTFTIPYLKGSQKNLHRKEAASIDASALGRLKVLLVEDNEVNQCLAQSIMEEWGLIVISAFNGLEALELLSTQVFDVILMDIHMPLMDGLETTAIIRQMSDKKIASLPIIAVTADALKGDEEKYIASGMNDYLTKPFNEEALFYKLLKNVKPSFNLQELSEHESNPLFKNEGAYLLYDLSQVMDAAKGNLKSVEKIISVFIQSTPIILKQMEEGLTLENEVLVKQLAHKLKTSIDTMEITVLKNEIRAMENFSSDQKNDFLKNKFDVIKNILEKVLIQLSDKMNSLQHK